MGTGLSPLAILVTNDAGTCRCLAIDIPRPFSAANQDLRISMARIVFPIGESSSTPTGEFFYDPTGCPIPTMLTVEEIRRKNLQSLVERHNGMANLCEKLGYARNETAALTRIQNANVRHDRGGKPYNMGSPMAREFELKLNLEPGWMDNDHDSQVNVTQLDLPRETGQWPFSVEPQRLKVLNKEDWIRVNTMIQTLVETREADRSSINARSAA